LFTDIHVIEKQFTGPRQSDSQIISSVFEQIINTGNAFSKYILGHCIPTYDCK